MSRPPLALRGAPLRPGAAARPGALLVLWRFSRPHTLIGTTLGIAALWVIGLAQVGGEGAAAEAFDLFWTVVAGACVNVFIVGVNQLEDVEIDRVNKPWLPVAAGELSPEAGRRVVAACAVLPVALAVTQGAVELAAVGLALAVGWAYSCAPLRLKRFPPLAAASITLVRTLVVNLGVWWHFAGTGDAVPAPVWALVAVTLPFSLAIAILKDVPDIEGDRRYGIATFSVRLGGRAVLRAGLSVLIAAEVAMLAAAPLLHGVSAPVLLAGHAAGLAALLAWAARADPADRAGFARFYQRVWLLFFWEYLVVALAAVAA